MKVILKKINCILKTWKQISIKIHLKNLIENNIPFFDVLVDVNNNQFKIIVHKKQQTKNFADSECVDR